MTQGREEELIAACFREVVGTAPSAVVTLRPHASERRIYRLTHGSTSLVGVHNASKAENEAFVSLAKHFKKAGLPVPTIHAYKPELGVYLEDDLGDTTLLDFLTAERAKHGDPFPASAESAYVKAMEFLPRFQIESAATLDFSLCTAAKGSFSVTLQRDIGSFLKDFVGRFLPSFDQSSLDGDFRLLTDFLSQAQSSFFLYRDFQARNVMLKGGEPFFIDFQSGSKGPLQYDVASMLFQSSAQLPDEKREALLDVYLSTASRYTKLDRVEFSKYYPGFIVSRMLQVLGVYGRQGLVEKKDYFTRSIPAALATLSRSLSDPLMPVKLRGLIDCSQALLEAQSQRQGT